jgi:glucoamylase
MEAMARMASPGGMLPEQVWDAAPIPGRGLYPGQATGSAMPLAWTHAEYLKLVASRALKRPFDRPDSVWRRYGGKRSTPSRATWCEHAVITTVTPGISVVLALREPAVVRYGFDGWRDIVEAPTTPNSLGVHVLTIDTSRLVAGQRLDFTFRYVPGDRWVGEDYRLSVEAVV